jgi:hypothetical protein
MTSAATMRHSFLAGCLPQALTHWSYQQPFEVTNAPRSTPSKGVPKMVGLPILSRNNKK